MRIERKLSDYTRKRISESMKGRPKSASHREAIRRGMLRYWENVPHVKEEENNNANVEPFNYEPMEETSND